ncbi:MAG: M20/M25/M40 family metallo-hydrolase [Bacteroidetes bacterium]|nr:MAG: M20/M25/M40 family metallo-hydrolase [Bacteroidota bacterium]
MKKFLGLVVGMIVILVGIILVKTYSVPDIQPAAEAVESSHQPLDSAAEHLAQAISFATISHHPAMMDTETFDHFHNWLGKTYPTVFSTLEVDTFGTHSLLLKWSGKSANQPILFMAHQDVVPIDQNANWEYPAFGNLVQGDYIYGRGALDDKGALISIFEAMEALAKNKFIPEHDVYFAFGQDEEIGGKNGAQLIAQHFEKLGLRFRLVLDEGGIISEGIIPGLEQSVALIGTAEKGYISLDVETHFEGGHSSMPQDTNAITLAADVINALRNHPFESRLCGSMEGFLEYLGPHFSFTTRMAAANRWAFEGVIINAYSAKPSGAALVHTTCTPTITRAGIKDNVIPMRALVTFNSRILPGETEETVIAHYEKALSGLPVKITVHDDFSENPSPISDHKAPEFLEFANVVKRNYPDCLVAPYLVLGATDGRYMTDVSDHVYRFLPFRFKGDDLARLHGVNERVSVNDFENAIVFYMDAISSLSN